MYWEPDCALVYWLAVLNKDAYLKITISILIIGKKSHSQSIDLLVCMEMIGAARVEVTDNSVLSVSQG